MSQLRWEVDAVITDDGTLLIDGTYEFDSLDEAALHLEVTNIPGFEFWAVEFGEDAAPLVDLVQSGRRLELFPRQ